MCTKKTPTYATILVDSAIDRTLDYAIPIDLQGQIQRGSRVIVPLRHQKCSGTVIALKETSSFSSTKAIQSIAPERRIAQELMDLAEWMARYYATPLRIVLRSLLPASVRKDVGHKEQLFVKRSKSKELIREHLIAIREGFPAQALVLEVMLKVKKGLFLTELMAQTESSRSPIDTLVKGGWLELEKVTVDRSPLDGQEYIIAPPKNLNEEQRYALQQVVTTLETEKFQTHLLYGITGSGKTEIYLQAMEKALEMGKSAILLVPEIALTTQSIERLRSRFKDAMAVLHCRLSDGERYDAWHRMQRGDIKIAIGARSAIFSPLPSLGLIVVDEEHESSYKQNEQMPTYHARDIAIMRAKFCGATVVLGSATPCLESYHNAKQGKYNLLCLSERADNARLPNITVIDMKQEYERAQGWTCFSQPLLDALKERFARREQAILFLNRRGYHTLMLCQACGESIKCRHCDTALTFHKGEQLLACHLCGFSAPPPRHCPSCKSTDSPMKFRGIGTELVESSLHALFPDIRTLRIDADTTRHKGSHEQLLRAFASGKADVLIGTQMVAKGLHFPEVTLAAILNADSALHIPDYRSSENTFQLLTQVAGRAGRGSQAGEVIIQTLLPENPTILHASKHDFETFYAEEVASRSLFGFPPFAKLVKITCSGKDCAKVEAHTQRLHQCMLKGLPREYTLHPVIPAAHVKVKDDYRYQFLIRGPGIYPIADCYSAIIQELQQNSVKSIIDVNPSSTFF